MAERKIDHANVVSLLQRDRLIDGRDHFRFPPVALRIQNAQIDDARIRRHAFQRVGKVRSGGSGAVGRDDSGDVSAVTVFIRSIRPGTKLWLYTTRERPSARHRSNLPATPLSITATPTPVP